MRYTQYIVILIFFFISAYVSAQGFDIMKLESRPFLGNSKIEGIERLELKVPLLLRENNQFILAPNSQLMHLDHSFPFDENRFYSLNMPMIWQHRMTEKFNVVFLFMPSLSATTGNYSNEALIWTGGLSFALNSKRKFNWQLGVLYSYRYKNNLIVPLIGFRWSQRGKINISASFPNRLGASWNFSKNMLLGLRMDNNTVSTFIPRYDDFDYSWFQERNIIPYTDIRIYKKLWFRLDVGYTYKRDMKLYKMPEENQWGFGANFNNNSTESVWENSEIGLFVNFGIVLKAGNR